MEKYVQWKYKHSHSLFMVVNKDLDIIQKYFDPDPIKQVLDRALEVLLEDGYVRIIQGPGAWLTWDLEGGENNGSILSPDGEMHSFCMPPEYYDQLDDEIKAKLK